MSGSWVAIDDGETIENGLLAVSDDGTIRKWSGADPAGAESRRSAAQIRADSRARRRAWWVHNLIAHPLLVLCPPAGEWLHDRTAPEVDR